jgi:integral membrane protein
MSAVARWFRVVAVVEAVSWTALLVTMFLKYVVEAPHEGGVPVAGRVHGAAFTLYVLSTLVTARRFRWSLRVTFLGLVASVPPFGSIVFERWATRTGRLGVVPARPGRRSPAGVSSSQY